MMLTMYAIKDELNGFSAMIPFMNEDLAKRYLRDQTIENPTIKNTPQDFSIWKICNFDTETAKITDNNVELIERAYNGNK